MPNQHLPPKQQQTLEQALAHHNQGALTQAITLYRQVLQKAPGHFDTLHLLGVATLQMGDPQSALPLLEQAIANAPQPSPTFYNSLAEVQRTLGHHPQAVESYQKALELAPDDAALHLHLGQYLMILEAWPQAAHHLERHVALDPQARQGVVDLAKTLHTVERLDEAAALYQCALQWEPGHFGLHIELGNALLSLGRHEEAGAHYRQAMTLNPEAALPYHNLGLIYLEKSLWTEAEQQLREAIARDSRHAQSHNKLAIACQKQNRLDEAIKHFELAQALDPQDHGIYNNLGNAYQILGDSKGALRSYQKALELDPGNPITQSNQLLCRQYLPEVTAASLYAQHRAWGEEMARRYSPLATPGVRCSDPAGPLRVGILSIDLRQHPVGILLLAWLEQRHHASEPLEIQIYSDLQAEDTVTERLRQASDGFHAVAHLSHQALAEKIHRDRVDILFDMGGHTAGNRLPAFAMRPAPVQITWAGYVGTTGLPTMDYLLCDDRYVPEEEARFYTEKRLSMPHCYAAYRPLEEPPPPAVPAPCLEKGYVTFGALQNPTKINRRVAERWALILAAVPDSRLLLQYPFMTHPQNRARILAPMQALGIDEKRIIFHDRADQAAFLARYREIDIALDTFPYSGGLTTCEALWMGVPVVTFPGRSFAGRHAVSYLHAAGLQELIAPDEAGYGALAVELAGDHKRLAGLHETLRDQVAQSPMADGVGFAEWLHERLVQMFSSSPSTMGIDT